MAFNPTHKGQVGYDGEEASQCREVLLVSTGCRRRHSEYWTDGLGMWYSRVDGRQLLGCRPALRLHVDTVTELQAKETPPKRG